MSKKVALTAPSNRVKASPMATMIDGTALAQKIRKEVAKEVEGLKKKGVIPGLAFIVVGLHPPSQIYVDNKQKACAEVGIKSFLEKYPEDISEKELLSHLDRLGQNRDIHGILVQLPLPPSLHAKKILSHIAPEKDVDGLHPENLGKLVTQQPCLKACTPQGILRLIESTGVVIRGKNACVVGRSAIVGLPTALLLLQQDATVTLCHSQTKNLKEKIAEADILVAAIGKPETIRGDWIKEGAIVIDVGIHRYSDGKIVGDVHFESASQRNLKITPVPGGVGPMTIAMLLKNTVEACLSSQ